MRRGFQVRCGGPPGNDAELPSYSAARSYALGVANRLDVQCAITDPFQNIEIVVRSGPIDPRRREYDPYRKQPFFHPNPEHPRSRKRFLRNEPQGWTPGGGPAHTQIRPQEFFGMNDQPSLLAVIAPPALLLGVVLFLARGRELEGLAEDTPVPAPRKREMPAIRNRHAARKLYGSAVLTAQAAASMRKLALDTRDREVASQSVRLQMESRRLLTRASQYDAGFVRSKLA